MRVSLRILAVAGSRLLPVMVGSAACGDGAPTGSQAVDRGFTVVSGPARSDTTLAIPGPLLVELRDENLAIQPGANVAIRSLMRGAVPTMYLDAANPPSIIDSVSRTTDDRGRFTIAPRFGRLAGAAGLVLSAPALSIVDTIHFTVLPGAAYRVAIAPHDTAVRLNRDVVLSIAVRDRYGNVRPEVPTIQAGPGIRVQGDGRVTGLSHGRATLVAKFGAFSDTGSVTVVPPGRLAGMHGSSVFYAFVVNTDGSGADRFLRQVGWPGGAVRWSRDGAHVLLSAGFVWTGSFRLYEVAVSDRSERLVWSPPQGTHQGWPDYSRNGEWIYFVHVVGRWDYAEDGIAGIWRVRPDGSSAEEIVPPPRTGRGWISPSLSPDGNHLAYVGGDDGTLFVRTLGDGATRAIAGLSATSVQWSPNGDRLLVAGRLGLIVVGPDGSGRRQLRTGVAWGRDAAWSPDGNWVVWNSGGGVELAQLDPELFLTLPFFREPAFSGGWGFAWTSQL